MNGWRSIALIARQDLIQMLWRREAVLWVFVMPVVFFYFMGMTTAGIGSLSSDADESDPLGLWAPAESSVLIDELIARLEAENFRVDRPADAEFFKLYARQLTLTPLDDGRFQVRFVSSIEGPVAGFDQLRLDRAFLGVLGDALVIELEQGTLSAEAFDDLAAIPRNVSVRVQPAGRRLDPPGGVAQAVPGTLVMFTMLILTTAGAVHLALERNAGLFRRLATTPISRGQIIAGKFISRMGLALVQISFAIVAGTLLFGMDWGPSVLMVLVVLLVWGAFNASLAMVLGNLARTEAQATGIGVLATLVLAALGGAWWPIEIAPEWMQRLALALPTGWAMDALHKLVSFAYPAVEVLPHLIALLVGALLLAWLGTRTFRYS